MRRRDAFATAAGRRRYYRSYMVLGKVIFFHDYGTHPKRAGDLSAVHEFPSDGCEFSCPTVFRCCVTFAN